MDGHRREKWEIEEAHQIQAGAWTMSGMLKRDGTVEHLPHEAKLLGGANGNR